MTEKLKINKKLKKLVNPLSENNQKISTNELKLIIISKILNKK